MFDRQAVSGRMACLINPRAANSKWVKNRRLRGYLQKKLPGEVIDVYGDVRTTVEMARKACEDAKILVAVGGDGTIADALQGIRAAGKLDDIIFAVIPFGSGNAFRKAVGVPMNTRRAINRLAKGTARRIDLIQMEDRCFGFASVGATAAATEEKHVRNLQGFWAQFRTGRRLLAYRRDEKTVELRDGLDDRGRPFEKLVLRSRFFDCVVAKTGYYGYGWRMAPKAKVDDGYLDVTLFEINPTRYAFSFPFIYFGLSQQFLPHYKARSVVITGKDLPVQYHGEYLGERDRVEFTVLPQALTIIAPGTKRGRRLFSRPPGRRDRGAA